MNKFRKFIMSSRKHTALYFAFCFFLIFSLRNPRPTSLMYNMCLALVAGAALAFKIHKDGGNYIIRNIREGRTDVTQRFTKMLKRGEVPSSGSEQFEYLEFLEATEKTNGRSRSLKVEIGSLIFLFLMFVLGIFAGIGLVAAGLFAGILLVVTWSFIRSRKILQRVDEVKAKMSIENNHT